MNSAEFRSGGTENLEIDFRTTLVFHIFFFLLGGLCSFFLLAFFFNLVQLNKIPTAVCHAVV
jgi:hypothetical protein